MQPLFDGFEVGLFGSDMNNPFALHNSRSGLHKRHTGYPVRRGFKKDLPRHNRLPINRDSRVPWGGAYCVFGEAHNLYYPACLLASISCLWRSSAGDMIPSLALMMRSRRACVATDRFINATWRGRCLRAASLASSACFWTSRWDAVVERSAPSIWVHDLMSGLGDVERKQLGCAIGYSLAWSSRTILPSALSASSCEVQPQSHPSNTSQNSISRRSPWLNPPVWYASAVLVLTTISV